MKFNSIIKTILILVWLALPSLCFSADDQHALFTQANSYYAKAQYTEAFNTYKKIIDAGYRSAAVYFNMGNASYKNGDIPSAILYYEKAQKLSPGDEDINFNIQLANLKTTDKIDAAPEFFLTRWWKSIILSFSSGAFAVLSIAFLFLGSALLIVYFFSNAFALKKYAFYLSVILFVIGLFTVFLAGRQASYFDGHKEAIVFNTSVNVKSSPNDRAGTLFVMHDGTKVSVHEKNNGWLKIGLVNGSEGWIKMADVREI